MDIGVIFFKNLSPDVRELLIPEGVHVTSWPPTETNHPGKQRLLLVKNAAVEFKKKQEQNIGSATRKWRPPSREIHGHD